MSLTSSSGARSVVWCAGSGDGTPGGGPFVVAGSGVVDAGDALYGVRVSRDATGRAVLLGGLREARPLTPAMPWAGALALPRQVVAVSNSQLAFPPLPEALSRRSGHARYAGIYVPAGGTYSLSGLAGGAGAAVELDAVITPGATGVTAMGLVVLASPEGGGVPEWTNITLSVSSTCEQGKVYPTQGEYGRAYWRVLARISAYRFGAYSYWRVCACVQVVSVCDSASICACVCVRMFVCVCACMPVRVASGCMCACVCVRVFTCGVCVCVCVCGGWCVRACVRSCALCWCVFLRMCVRMCVCVACVCVRICM